VRHNPAIEAAGASPPKVRSDKKFSIAVTDISLPLDFNAEGT
jgi:hypothetical protein